MTSPLLQYNRNDAGFSSVSPSARPLENDPTVSYATTLGSTTKQSSSSSKVNTTQIFPNLTFPGASSSPPPPPDYSNLTAIQQEVRRKSAIAAAMKQYDELSAATQATGFQAANNAGNVYANRTMQSGINPVASGVVAAQARLPIYKQLADIGVQKEQTRLDATNKADSLAASIAANIGQLQMGYANMLADYNSKQTGYNLDLTKFNASLGNQQSEYQQDYALKAAQLALQTRAAGGGSGGSNGSRSSGGGDYFTPGAFDPGYITNAGPIHGSSVNPNMVFTQYKPYLG